jgi:hypothetical protein
MKWSAYFWVFFVGLASLYSPNAQAIPAFARTYKVPCSTCHIAIARRNEFGDVFRRSGYRWPGEPERDERTRKPEPIRGFGSSAMLSLLPSVVPLGFASSIAGTVTTDPEAEHPFSPGSPSVSFLVGTPIGEHLSLFGILSSGGGANEFYMNFTRVLAGRPELNVRVGLFEQWTTLFKQNEAILDSFLLSSKGVNGLTLGKSRWGVETNGVLFDRTFWAAGLVKAGNSDRHYNGYYHLSHKFGGVDFNGEEPDDLFAEPSFFDDFLITLGHWGYFGDIPDNSGGIVSQVKRFGLDAKLRYGSVMFWGGVMAGLDRDLAVELDTISLTGFAELSWMFNGWIMPMYLYQYQDSYSYERVVQEHTVGVIFVPLENIRLRVKFGFSDDAVNNESGELQLFVGF